MLAKTQAVAGSTHAIAARVAVLEQGQWRHPPISQQHIPMGVQLAGAALAAFQLLPCPPRGFEVNTPQGVPEPNQLAATTAVIKANDRLVADVWRSIGGTRRYIAQGTVIVAEEFTPHLLRFILEEVAGVTAASTSTTLALFGHFRGRPPPPPLTLARETPITMPADVYF